MAGEEVKRKTTIGGVEMVSGDTVRIAIGRRVIEGTFIDFDRMLYAFIIKTSEGVFVIPYKNVRYLQKL